MHVFQVRSLLLRVMAIPLSGLPFNVLWMCSLLLLSVVLSDYYDLPFNDILDWRKFSLVLRERDVYSLKQILKAVSDEEFAMLHKRLVEVWRSLGR